MKAVQNDEDSLKLRWTEAVNLAHNRPFWRLLATSDATRSYRCVPGTTLMGIILS